MYLLISDVSSANNLITHVVFYFYLFISVFSVGLVAGIVSGVSLLFIPREARPKASRSGVYNFVPERAQAG